MVVDPRRQTVREGPPARSDVGAGEFEPCEQRHRADLVLAVVGAHAPDLRDVQRERLVETVLLDQEQRQVPPVFVGSAAPISVASRFSRNSLMAARMGDGDRGA